MADSIPIEGVLGAANAEVRLSVAGFGGVAIQVQGTFSGTITFEASVQGQDFTAFRVTPPNSSTPTTTTTTTGVWVGSVVGYLVIRARMSSYSSGQATVFLRADVPSPGGASGGGGSGSDVNLIEVGGSTIALGQAAMASSLPVVIASDQSAVDVNIVGGGGSGGTSSDFGDPFPAAGTAIGVADPDGNMAPLSAETLDYDTGAGTVAQTIMGLALPGTGGPVAGGTATNPVRVDPTGTTTQPVSAASLPLPTGAATAANQTTGNTSLATIAGAVSGTEMQVDVLTSALPTGAATAAKQPALGTAGTASADVITVQGIASMTPLLVTPAANSAVNVAQINGVTPLMGAGNTGTGSPRVTIATDQAVIPVGGNIAADAADSGNPVKVGAVAYSPDGTEPGTPVAEGDRSNAKCDLDGSLYVNKPATTPVHLNGSSAYTDQAFFPDPGDGYEIVMTSFQCSSGAATAINFFLEEGSTVKYGPIYLEAVAGRGFCSGPISRRFTSSTAVTLTSSAAIAQSIDAEYYIRKV